MVKRAPCSSRGLELGSQYPHRKFVIIISYLIPHVPGIYYNNTLHTSLEDLKPSSGLCRCMHSHEHTLTHTHTNKHKQKN